MKAPLSRTHHGPWGPARLLLAALVLILPMASCDMLFVGIFPADIAQATARRDLSGRIPAAAGASYNLSVVKLGSAEYVILFSADGYDQTSTHLFVLSPTLTILNTYSLYDIVKTVPPTDAPFKGSAAAAHLYDMTVVVGNLVMTPGASGLTPSLKLASPTQLNGDAISGPGPGYLLMTNFWVDSSQNLNYDQYSGDWSMYTAQSRPIGKDVHFAGAFTDPEDASNNTAMLVFEDGSNTQYFVQVPKDPDMTGTGSSTPLLGTAQYLPFTTTNLDAQSLQVTKTGIVSYDYSSKAWVRFLPSSPLLVSRMDVGRRAGSERSAFSYSGGFYCVFDTETRELTRYEDWW